MSIFSKQPPKSEETSGIKKAAQAISTGVLILCTLLCFVVVLQTALKQEVSLFGFRLFYVVTGSMEPTLPVNSLILVQEREEYEVGEIVTYYAKDAQILGRPNTHRIVAETEKDAQVWFTTQGDANPVPDPEPIQKKDIIGRVCFCFGAMGLIGTVLGMLSTPSGFFVIVLLPLLGIALYCMGEFKKVLNEELMRSAREALEAELTGEKEYSDHEDA